MRVALDAYCERLDARIRATRMLADETPNIDLSLAWRAEAEALDRVLTELRALRYGVKVRESA